jgi:hypothetical protein
MKKKSQKPTQTETLAREFSAVLREYMEPKDFTGLVARQKAWPREDICYSHDYCDANMAMEEAFQRVLGRTAILDESATLKEREDTTAMWDAAWTLAKRRLFFHKLKPMPTPLAPALARVRTVAEDCARQSSQEYQGQGKYDLQAAFDWVEAVLNRMHNVTKD